MVRIRNAFLIVLLLTAYSSAADWPLKGSIDLSSGFGDYRMRRFHAGVDLRTGGRIGKQLLSPVDGYVWRIRTAYTGYGKVLYIKGDDGFIYVMAHLNEFNRTITELVHREQKAAERYYLDLRLPADSIRVTAGEYLGKTGKTGSGAPHLHFEKRTADNVPINPLNHGFALPDHTPPTFKRLGLQMTDDRSLFLNGRRTTFLALEGGGSDYRLPSPVFLDRPFGVLADCYDQHRSGGMRQAVHRLRLTVDGSLYYEVVLDTLEFADGVQSDLEYDLAEVVQDRKRVRRLYAEAGNTLSQSKVAAGERGVVGGARSLAPGRHTAEVTAEDSFGNQSTLRFDFIWGPGGDLLPVDSVLEVDDSTRVAYFTPTPVFHEQEMHVWVEIEEGSQWERLESSTLEWLDDGSLKATVRARPMYKRLLRLASSTADGATAYDQPFNGVNQTATAKIAMSTAIVEDGGIVSLQVGTVIGSRPRVFLYQGDTVAARIPNDRFYLSSEYHIFVPPMPGIDRIDSVGVVWAEKDHVPSLVDTVSWFLVGDEDNESITVDSLLWLTFDRSVFYRPRWVQLRSFRLTAAASGTNSNQYVISPPSFITRKDFGLHLKLIKFNRANKSSGICWLDEKDEEFVWLDGNTWSEDEYTLRAESAGGGTFVSLFDTEPPEITALNHRPNAEYPSPKREIRFRIEDNLSGIRDDRDIVIKFDGEWMIPEYDPESGICKTERLPNVGSGTHHIAIQVTDRAGNLAEQYVTFSIN